MTRQERAAFLERIAARWEAEPPKGDEHYEEGDTRIHWAHHYNILLLVLPESTRGCTVSRWRLAQRLRELVAELAARK